MSDVIELFLSFWFSPKTQNLHTKAKLGALGMRTNLS